ncbi:glycosyltransferase family protein [Leptothoe spongobia]|uniref:Glucosyl-3-phosphoglycerate synthase n=1 Tax=Leptothoe spongobia TAU-MAC 1115 TaxID=1967444 RepID=A0A947GJS6_9CYAN|nr:glucosyl-3-phosphoglycerate synthase [Leptothoe spongobia]MBT9317245.1 glucosyl-3-phosphoglycerate synthase [Leptothoe spongobia TAU-MAC 1115]
MDYKQERITTIHDFGGDLSRLEERACELTHDTPTAVLIPSLYEELERPALSHIRDQLKDCVFVNTVIVSLYADNAEQYAKAVEFFRPLPQKTHIIWENGPRVIALLKELQKQGMDILAHRGKGRAVWLGLGLATLYAGAIALHDADIITYDKTYPLKLLFPLLEPEFGIAFTKAYYARISSEPRKMNGRVTRLFVTPLLHSLMDVWGHRDYISYLSAYRYPLSGEFALTSDLALTTRVPANWGLEVGLLAEVYRNVALKRIAQVDLGTFDHKHQNVGQSPNQGLQKMCRDILHSLLRTLTETEQVVIGKDQLRSLRIKFRREAQDLARQYFVDARFNGLQYDRHQEENTLEKFEEVIIKAGDQYLEDPTGTEIPDWTRALAVMPDLRQLLGEAVTKDMQEVLEKSLPPFPKGNQHNGHGAMPTEGLVLTP